jgi:saccharopine dehydrogenase-like NADP-dependent oxidoreductase
MKIVVFGGSGKIGSAVAWDLARDPAVSRVGLVGRSRESLERVKRWIGAEKIELHVAGVEDRSALAAIMGGYDAGALALPDRRTSYRVIDVAIEARLSIVDMLEEYHRRPDLYETEGLELPEGLDLYGYGDRLHERAIANDVVLVDGMGFAPGLSNITVGDAISRLDRAISAIARVGGIPEKAAAARHPLRYMITWAFDHVLREYVIRLLVRKNGENVEVEAGTGREVFHFDRFGKSEALECAITPGMPSFLYTRPDLLEFAEKTIRWPGHWEGVQTLKECGLLDLAPVEVNGVRVVPRDLLLATLVPRLRPREGERDACVMYNTVHGTKGGMPVKIEHFLWDEGEPEHGITGMMRVTGYPVAIAARLVAQKKIRERGIVPPEDCIRGETYRWFLAELSSRGIRVDEAITEDV